MQMPVIRRAVWPLVLSSVLVAAHSRTPAGRQSVSVDLPMLARGPMPAIEVKVNGRGPFLFAIDTGASGKGRVDASLVTALGLPQIGEARGADGSGAPAKAMAVVQVDTLTIGSLELHGLAMPSRDYNTSPSLPHIDGILGFNLFADYLLTLDYPGKRVRIESGQLPSPDQQEILSFDAPAGIPVVDLQVGARTIKTHLDSGNTAAAFMLPGALAETLTFKTPPDVVGRARTITTEVEIKRGQVAETIRLGRFEFALPTVTYPAVSDQANIGPDALRDFMLTFDQKHRCVRLTRR